MNFDHLIPCVMPISTNISCKLKPSMPLIVSFKFYAKGLAPNVLIM